MHSNLRAVRLEGSPNLGPGVPPHEQPPPDDLRPTPIPGAVKRIDLLAITEITRETFDAMARRGQLPLAPMPGVELVFDAARQTIPEEWQGWCDARGYTPLTCFALIVSNELVRRFNLGRDAAALAAVTVLKITPEQWATISRDSKKLPPAKGAIMLGIFARDGAKSFTYAIGTAQEFADRFVMSEGFLAVSLTKCATLMRQRAAEHGINLDGFWSE